jgi:hypothetical protein
VHGSSTLDYDTVDFAGRHLHLPLGIRSGGHGLSGRSTNDGGIVIDLRHLNGTHVLEPAAQLVRIGPGARWRGVAAALQPHGWALSSGDSGAVDVGGLATSDGIGLLARAPGTRGGRQPGTGGPIGRWLTKRVMNRFRRKGEAMGIGFNALVLTTIRCTSGRERTAVASMGGRDPR